MGLLDIRDDPDYVNANAATKQAIFDEYSKDDPDYINANQATKDAIRQEFGLSVGPTTSEVPDGVGVPQALTIGREVAGPVKDIAQTAYGVGKAAIGYPIDTLRNAITWTPRSIYEVVSSPIATAKQYIGNNPVVQNIMNSNASLSSVGRQAVGKVADVGGRIVAGAVAPESLFAAPYQMAAYEQEKIRQNPNAPEYATNPYAQAYRGEYRTQGQAGAANRRATIASQQYGGLTQEEQDILEEDRIRREIRRKAAEKALGPIAP